jgi:CheY-like chemotaxis protein
LKFFIVDDDDTMIQLMEGLITASGHEVSSALAGHQAISGITAMKPDCIITDLMMATMDGLELCDAIRANKSVGDTTIVMVSARDAEHWKSQAAERGADGYITKPIDPETFLGELLAIIEKTG